MKNKRAALRTFAVFLLLVLPYHTTAGAEELDLINRPVNTSGLTGLLFATMPFTLPQNVVEIAASVMHESSDTPDYTLTEFPLSITLGLPYHAELALKSSYFNVDQVPGSGLRSSDRKSGNAELSYKWNFLLQPEDSFRPAIAFLLSGIAPTDSYQDRVIHGVKHWGARMGLAIGSEINLNDYTIGIYADIQAQAQDLNQANNRDIFGVGNIGLLIPVSKYRNLQMFLEYNQVFGREWSTIDGADYFGLTYGIRLVSERFNFTIGTQFKQNQAGGYSNSSKLIGQLSMKI